MYMRRRHNYYAHLHLAYMDFDWQEFLNNVKDGNIVVNMNDERLMIEPIPFLNPQLFFS
jgi:uncharacterized membrane protein YobD (UPF0266 family)